MAIGTTSEFDKYTSVSGNAPGMPTKATTPRLPAGIAGRQGMNSISKYEVQNLAYPLNVERTPNNPITDGNGHYIIFEIMKQDPAKLRINRAAKGLANVISNTAKQHALATKEQKGRGPFSQNVPSKASMTAQAVSKYAISGVDAKGVVDAYRKGGSVKGSGTGSIQLQNAATTKMKVAIALYMPPSVKVSYGAKYGDVEIGAMAELGRNAIAAFMDDPGNLVSNLSAAVGGTGAGVGVGAGLAQTGMKALDVIAPGSSALIAIERGKVMTPRMELMFEGLDRREFSYEFTFIPKDMIEAQRVEEIIKKFKFHMSADYGGTGFLEAGVREMGIPDFFNIRYMYKNQQNTHLNLIKTCVLTKMDVDYGSDRYAAYAEGRPQTTKVSLSFTEMEIITKSDIEKSTGAGY